MKNMYTRTLVCLLIMFLIRVISGSSSSEFDVGVGVVLDANSSEGILGLRDPREQAINASASDLDEYAPYAKADGTSAGSYNDQTILQEFNAAVGNDKITANRSMYVVFKGQVSMIFKSLMRSFLLIIIASLIILIQWYWHEDRSYLKSTYTASPMRTYTVSTGSRDVNRLEYFSMTTFNPRHAREIPGADFDNGGSGGGGGGYSSAARGQPREMDSGYSSVARGQPREMDSGYSSAARGQPREMDTDGMRHWWKKAGCFLRKMAPRH